ncbi:MAG: GTPase ObgE [Muribaculaceae bacterium]|nr:GTPase ObgE [Muribaculaceae bacterium]
MPESNFIDYVKILCRSGKGGAGSAHLHRAKDLPKGGPDGGDGGRGGHIYLKGNRNLWTLIHLKFSRHIFATDGQPGYENRSSGKDGQDRTIEVPCGTAVYDAESGEFLAEVTGHGQVVKLLQGGRGGLGNFHFKTATRQTPRFAQPGEPGVEKAIILELKLLADVGLVGFPNAGKSTLLSVISAAKPKIANYPFTTLEPNLGIVTYRDMQSFVMADIPGIIEGASEGRGLGLRFLRHIERNAVLLFMIPADSDDIAHEYDVLCRELETFNPDLVEKPRVLAITKCDMLDDELLEALRGELPADVEAVFISSVAQQGLTELKDLLWRTINDERNRIPAVAAPRQLDEQHRDKAEDNFIFSASSEGNWTEDENAGGHMTIENRDWSDEYWESDYVDENDDFQVVSDPDEA